ncbi:MBL fold metallo-hydrolase [Nocardioides mangrovi]|uniref:MBL fold metallo-hydrolase n=1 Tax=Nocardioides mangrovi TaxID=2874580 RepID=A0ABS7UJI9_9ACTN|nr:MBL fold metallo-hydrolase [Nocardioides mangrovi]MBZ5740942.1 MBL fold metallo-hydrolase [Nocardioides mangrovi]
MTWNDGTAYLDELAPGVHAYVQPAGGWMVNNCGVITDASGDAVLVDTTSTEKRNRALLAEVSRVAPHGPRLAVNTHHHPDHTYGNGFLPARTTIIGHHLCREGVRRAGLAATQELPADYGDLTVRPPDLTIGGDVTLHLDGFPVELRVLGPAHSTHDVGVWLPEQRVMFAGDLAFSGGGHPIFLEGSMHGFRDAVRRMRELAPEVLLPGHGPVCRGEEVGRVLDELEAYVDWTEAVARESIAAGLSPLEAALEHRDGPYRAWAEGERVVCNLHRAYVELSDLEPSVPLSIPALWSEMVALHGGPIVSHA